MAKKPRKKPKGRSRVPKKENAAKTRRLPEVLGWETFAALLVPCAIGAWYFLRPVFEEDATTVQKSVLALVVGTVASGLITWAANAVWRRVMRVR